MSVLPALVCPLILTDKLSDGSSSQHVSVLPMGSQPFICMQTSNSSCLLLEIHMLAYRHLRHAGSHVDSPQKTPIILSYQYSFVHLFQLCFADYNVSNVHIILHPFHEEVFHFLISLSVVKSPPTSFLIQCFSYKFASLLAKILFPHLVRS